MNNGEVKPTDNRLSPEGRNKWKMIFPAKTHEQNPWRRAGGVFPFSTYNIQFVYRWDCGVCFYLKISGLAALYAVESLREGRETHEQHSRTFKQSNF